MKLRANFMDVYQQIAQQLSPAHRILLVSHVNPDGDAIGAILGLGLALTSVGKMVQMVIEDDLPSNFLHLEGISKIQNYPVGEFDLVVLLDCSDLDRAGSFIYRFSIPDINIDHHITNPQYAKINLVDKDAAATCELIFELLKTMAIPMTKPIAEALLSGLITDTIGFRTSSTRPKTLYLVAELMETGVDMPELYRKALYSRSFEEICLWGVGLNKIERDDSLVWTSLTLSDRLECNYSRFDDADLINILSAIEGSKIVVVFNEQPNNVVKVSWRAQPGWDVSKIAQHFGGGGHPAASGAEIQGNLSEVKKEVLMVTKELLKGYSD